VRDDDGVATASVLNGIACAALLASGPVAPLLPTILPPNGSLLELEPGVDEAPERDLGVVGGANAFVAFTGGFGSQVVLPTSLTSQKLVPVRACPPT